MTATSANSALNHPAPNAMRLLWAGFLAILAAGIGFGVRGGILDNWATEFHLTSSVIGEIIGAGFTGFCFGIIISGVIVDKLGYGKIVLVAFLLHVASALVTFAATGNQSPEVARSFLYWGMFLFALANGSLEGVANPLVATLFPKNRTHYLNILHASWPAGLILGGMIGWFLGKGGIFGAEGLNWRIQLGLFLIPTLLYGLAFLGQRFPKSEAAEKGLPFGEMMREIGLPGAALAAYLLVLFFRTDLGLPGWAAWSIGGVLLLTVGVLTRFSLGSLLLFVLYIAHTFLGAVELGTDNWIQNITGNLLTQKEGKILFVWSSSLMFVLRFCSGWIEKNLKLSPIGILLIGSIIGCIGLNLASGITTFASALIALGVYALGKTFLWPTMLAVIGDRFPKTGAVAMSIMGGIGMMSAGLIGSQGLGYAQDRFMVEHLQQTNPELYAAQKVEKSSSFLFFEKVHAVDQKNVVEAKDKPEAERSAEQKTLLDSLIVGSRKTLRADSFLPATMAGIYLLLLIYFRMIGGYKVVQVEEE